MGRFHNPYNFIPVPDRSALDAPFGDASPRGHESLEDVTYRGVIRVAMHTETPLFVPDAARSTVDQKHVTLPLRKVNGNAHLPPTSVKGMLRSAYETVTLSRFGVLNLRDPLGYRPEALRGLEVVPFRVTEIDDEAGTVTFDLFLGTAEDGVAPAAWIPMQEAADLGHGTQVDVVLRRYYYTRRSVRFAFYAVVAVGDAPIDPRVGQAQDLHDEIKVSGFVHVTARSPRDRNFSRKHHERLFFDIEEPVSVVFERDAAKRIRDRWRTLIADYHDAARSAAGRRWNKGRHQDPKGGWERLGVGTQGYAIVRDGQMVDVQPVLISRRLYETSPFELAEAVGVAPAASDEEPSMADRVFGWVPQGGGGAFRGKVTVGKIHNRNVHVNGGEQTLAILSTPRPAYGRFYVGKEGGEPWPQGGDKEDVGYDADNAALRGRKVYPHQLQPAYDGRYASTSNRGEQNRTMRGWIEAGSTFECDLRFEGLDAVELGALLWILDVENHTRAPSFHKLGSAKPFGYGSVTLTVVNQAVSGASEVRRQWLGEPSSANQLPDFVAEFTTAFEAATGSAFADHASIAAYLTAGRGLRGEVHYPGSSNQYDAQYEWFVQNERDTNRRMPLPRVGDQLTE